MNITEEHFRKTLGLFPTGVTVVTAFDEHGKDIGITISSFTSVSLNPAQILFCLSKHSKTMPVFKELQYFAVNILNINQSHLSDGFAKHVPLEWEAVKTHRHPNTGCLLISDALGYVVCEKSDMFEGGDHYIILGRVIDLFATPYTPPLVRQRGQYLTTQPILIEPSPLEIKEPKVCQKI
ncbi:MAG TPA: flavin reductase family protein [Alphaproteobacteria bacterium]|nr:flavin reductase family protein [Alphaproteobacteria bacterium]